MIQLGPETVVDCARKSLETQRHEFLPPLTDNEIQRTMKKFVQRINRGQSFMQAWAKSVEPFRARRNLYLNSRNGKT